MRNILLPTDFSDNSWSAIVYAIDLFIEEGAVFHLLHAFSPYVVAPSGPMQAQVMDETIFRAAEENSKRELNKFKSKILEIYPEANVKEYAKFDFFTNSIHRFLEDHDVNCIVMGTKGASGIKEIVMGSNTSSLIGKVKAPILAIPEDTIYQPVEKVVVCSDLNVVPTEKGVDLIRRLLELTGASLHVLNVLKSERDLTTQEKDIQDVYQILLKNHEVIFKSLIDKDVESGINLYVEEIDADMMCVIARKHSFLERLLERSKSKALTNHTKIPLLVLNEESL